eukprot:2758896-Rhodomonas_salina.6
MITSSHKGISSQIAKARLTKAQGWTDDADWGCVQCKMRATATGAAGGGVAAAAAASEYAIVTAAQTEARNVREAARVAAQALSAAAQNGATQVSAQAVREAATARREAADVLARARLEAQQMVMRAGEEAARLRHQARTQASEAQRAPLGGRSMLIVFFHGELAAATNDFAEENQIGGGGFGGVFCARRVRGFGDGVELAVKRLDADSRQGQVSAVESWSCFRSAL